MNAASLRPHLLRGHSRDGAAMDEAAWLIFGLGIGLLFSALLIYTRTELTGVRCEALLEHQPSLVDTLEVVEEWPRCSPWFDEGEALAQGWGES